MNSNIKEKEIEKEFVSKGFLIKDIIDTSLLDKFRKSFLKVIYKDFSKDIKALRLPDEDSAVLNNFHKFIAVNKLNSFRLKVYDYVNSLPENQAKIYSSIFEDMYYLGYDPVEYDELDKTINNFTIANMRRS